jgi:MoaA/NifB/PqqE/SkfB family radical SAM enzyme
MKKPLLLHYYITNRCNAQCAFCGIWAERPKIDASPEDVDRNLESARREGCRFVDFTGGEPLLHPGLPVFLGQARRRGLLTSVTTNCILFPQRAAELAGLVDLLHFSIDADSAELHDHIRGGRSFDTVLESIDIALSLKMSPDLLFTYTQENIDTIDGVYSIARKKKLILILDPIFDINGPDRLPRSVHEKALRHAGLPGVYLNRAHLALRKAGGNHVRSPLCKATTSTVVILPDNTLALPCYHHRTITVPIQGDLCKVLHSQQRAEAIEKEGKYAFCEGCHINCYFDPSYQYQKNRFFWLSMQSKWSYSWMKHAVYGRRIPKIWKII